jgi:hypothetical protein
MPRLDDFAPLTAPEAELLASLVTGPRHQCGDGSLPEAGDEARTIRAGLLRLLILGAEGLPPPHEKGLFLSGAVIAGTLDLESCRIPRDLRLAGCRFTAPLVLRSAVIDTVLLDGSDLPGLVATRLDARGSIYLRSARLAGGIDLLGARIGGDLMLDNATILHQGDTAFDGSHISMRGNLTLRGTRVRGMVEISGAQVGGDLVLTGLDLEHHDGPALDARRVQVQGDVSLRTVRIAGEVNLIGARVASDLLLDGGSFSAPGAFALTLNLAVIDGAIFMRDGTRLDGALSLNGTQVGLIVDDRESWPAPGDLLLNRFTYKGFLASPVDAASRLDWLSRQDPARWGEDFWPQPYEQLTAVLAAMGHQENARIVQFEKERLQRRAAAARAPTRLWRAVHAVKDTALLATVGYGLQPLFAFVWMGLLWAVGVGLLAAAQANGALRPNSPVMLRSPEWVQCGLPAGQEIHLPSIAQVRAGLAAPGQSQVACFLAQPEAAAYPRFNKWIYSLETMIPGLDGGQRAYWSPDTRFPIGHAGKIYEYLQTVLGYALGLLAFAGFSGLVKTR